MRTSRHRLVLMLMILALLATACRSGAGEEVDEPEAGAATDAPVAAPTDEPVEDGETPAAPSGDVQTDAGVTEEACPDAVNPDNGCIYLGTLSDLTEGPFAALGGSITEAQAAFWQRVNEDGGIGGFDVNVDEYVRDNKYNPQVTTQVYNEIKSEIAGIAQTLGSPPTAAIIDDVKATPLVAAPATWSSLWLYEDVIVESGNNYCIEAMNGVDWAIENGGATVGPRAVPDDIQTVMAVHYPGEYGEDGAAGVKAAAEANGIDFIDVTTEVGPDNQTGAISQIVQENPDLVYMTVAPTDFATLVGQAAAQNYAGLAMGQSPAFNEALTDSPAAQALEGAIVTLPWQAWDADTPGHQALRDTLEGTQLDAGYMSGWAWSYPLRAALDKAAENGDLTRQGILDAVTQLESVDYEGILPEGSGNFAGSPDEMAVRGTIIARISGESETQTEELSDGFYTGSSAEGYSFDGPCYENL